MQNDQPHEDGFMSPQCMHWAVTVSCLLGVHTVGKEIGMNWSQKSKSVIVILAIHPVMSLFPQVPCAAHLYSDTVHAPVHGTRSDLSGPFQP